jgi:hypothetical protein
MKKGLFLMVLFTFSFLLNSCKKDDNTDTGNPAYRVTSEITWNDDKLNTKKEYIYQDEKIKTVQYYVFVNPDWVITNKEEYEYPSEEMNSFIHYYNLGGKTWKESYKIECYNSNGKITRWIQYHHELGIWVKEFEEDFSYNEDGLISEWNEFDYSSGSKDLIYQEKYTYAGQQITSAEVYQKENGNVSLFAKLELSYENDILKSILASLKGDASWRENSRMDLSYLNNDLLSAGISFKDNGFWLQTETWAFNYDEFGNLTGELNDNIFHSDVLKTEYTYEKKRGNINDFNPPYNWVFDGYWYPQVTKKIGFKPAPSALLHVSREAALTGNSG